MLMDGKLKEIKIIIYVGGEKIMRYEKIGMMKYMKKKMMFLLEILILNEKLQKEKIEELVIIWEGMEI